MRIELAGRRSLGLSAWRKTWLQGICLLACGGLGVALVPLSQGHSDPSMFGQAAPAATAAPAPAGVSEVTLPPNAMGREQSLFGLAPVQAGPQASAIKTYGLVVPNSQAVVDVNIAVSGQVAEVYVRVGDSVRKGQPIASVFNPEFITTQKGYLEFLKNEAKLQVLREEGRLPNYLKDAKENLRWWGMSDKQVADLIDNGKVVEHIMLDAPSDGFITELFRAAGSLVNAGDKTMKQFVVVGRAVARMWPPTRRSGWRAISIPTSGRCCGPACRCASACPTAASWSVRLPRCCRWWTRLPSVRVSWLISGGRRRAWRWARPWTSACS